MSIIDILYQIPTREYMYLAIPISISLLAILFLFFNHHKTIVKALIAASTTLIPIALFFILYVLVRWKFNSSNFENYTLTYTITILVHFIISLAGIYSNLDGKLFLLLGILIIVFVPIAILIPTLTFPIGIFLVSTSLDIIALVFVTKKIYSK